MTLKKRRPSALDTLTDGTVQNVNLSVVLARRDAQMLCVLRDYHQVSSASEALRCAIRAAARAAAAEMRASKP